jgi:hypothetical protein
MKLIYVLFKCGLKVTFNCDVSNNYKLQVNWNFCAADCCAHHRCFMGVQIICPRDDNFPFCVVFPGIHCH